jgi:thiol-disulfide isomerase/thioredoxin
MEGAIFTKAEVLRRFSEMVLVRAYTDALTKISEEQRAYQIERFQTAALPFYAIIDPRDNTVLATFASMTSNVAKYLAFLDKGIDSYNDKTPLVKDSDPDAETDAGAFQERADGGVALPSKISLSLAPTGKKIDFELPTLEERGKAFSLSSKRGQWIFVNFWATWCVPCLKELNEDIPAALREAPNVQLVTVAFDGEETRQTALKILAEAKLPRHIALLGGADFEKAKLEGAFSVSTSLPQSFLIHPAGHIAWLHRGSITRDTLIRLFKLTSR